MEELFEDLELFLMHEEEAVQTNNAAEILGGEDNDDHMFPTGTISCFSNGTDTHAHLEETDWYTHQYSDLHFPDNQASNEVQHRDNLLFDVSEYLQENDSNCLIDQHIHDNETTWLLQQQAADNDCHDVSEYLQENDSNCLIDQHIQDNETTWLLQQQAADNDFHDDHQPQPSTLLLPVTHQTDELLINHSHSSTSEQQLLPLVQEAQERPSELHKLVGEPDVKRKKGRKKGKQVLTSQQQLLPQAQEPQERPSELLKLVGEPVVKRKKGRKKGKQVLIVNHGEEEDDALGVAMDDDEDDEDNNCKSPSHMSKNVVSERNRRKRLNQKLITLRKMVPNITKMDKRSVLVDALDYLRDMLHQTKIEMEKQNISSSNADAAAKDPGYAFVGSPALPDLAPVEVETDHPPCHRHLGVVSDKSLVNVNVEGLPQPAMLSTILEPPISPYDAISPAITKMEAEKVDEERYLLKIVYNKALGSMAQVQRSVEMLKGVEFTSVSIYDYDQHHMQSTSFLQVKKIKGSVLVADAENLLERVKTTAKQLGLRLPRVASLSED